MIVVANFRFVALGTSLPDTFASRIAAKSERTADNAIGNVTGSNSVNVFLGLGLPWVIASIYWEIKVNKKYILILYVFFSILKNKCTKNYDIFDFFII